VTTTTELYWDPYDTEIDSNPHPVWRRMRDEAPVWWNDRYGFFAYTRYADVEMAHKDPGTYSSAHSTVLELLGPNKIDSEMMIFMDPPEHTVLRSLVSRAFTPRRVSALEDHIRQLCVEMLEPQVGSSGFDYVQDFGAQLPSKVIAALIGVPADEREAARVLVDTVFHIEPGVGMINDISINAGIALFEYLQGLIEKRLVDPQDDMLTALALAEIEEDGVTRRLTTSEATHFAALLFNAGTETVARLLGNAAVILSDNPAERADMATHPEIIPSAVEELLRYEAPSPVQGRWTLNDVRLHDVDVPAGSKVLLLTGSAGRDERVFPDADRFDPRRKIDHHVSFGYGIHFCVGAALARMEGRIALEETLKRFPEWGVDHARAKRLHTSTVRGWSEVPITL